MERSEIQLWLGVGAGAVVSGASLLWPDLAGPYLFYGGLIFMGVFAALAIRQRVKAMRVKMTNCKAGFVNTAIDLGKGVELDSDGFQSIGNDQFLKAGDGSKVKLRNTTHIARVVPTDPKA